MIGDGEKMMFEGYSYRTDARFGSYVTISVNGGLVTITGPRISRPVYSAWIYLLFAILWVFIPFLLIMALVRRGARYLFDAFLLALAHLGIAGAGAAGLWEIQNITYIDSRGIQDTVMFPVSAVRNVRVGKGWARGIVRLAILPYVPGVDRGAEGHTVSFEAPDVGADRYVVYAIHMYTRTEAENLARILEGGA